MPAMADVQSQERVLSSLTSVAEKRLLIWLAERMPSWVTPDLLTIVGVLGSLIVFLGYLLSHLGPAYLWVVIAGLVVNWFGDSVDGTLARVRHIERPRYGFYVDHGVDVISQTLIILGIGASPFVHWQFAALVLIGYLSISVLTYVRAFVDGVFKISYGRIGPTEMRIVLALATLVMGLFPNPADIATGIPGHAESPYDLLLLAIAAILEVAFVVSFLRGARELADVDTRADDA